MRINGANILNSNNYKAISIHKNVNVLGTSYKNNLKVSKPLTTSLKGKKDQEKLEEIIRYFLRNHKIVMLHENRNEFIIQSQSGIDLVVDKRHTLSKELIKEILDKYSIDRMDSYVSSDVDFYWIISTSLVNSTTMDYSVGTIKPIQIMTKGLSNILKDKECMVIDIGLSYHYDVSELKEIKINSRDKAFLKRMLSDIETASFYTTTVYSDSSVYKCRKGNKDVYLVIDKEISEFIVDIDEKISSDKEEKVKRKNLQYRMEEFI